MRVAHWSLVVCALSVPRATQADTVSAAAPNGAGERPAPAMIPAAGLASVTDETPANDLRHAVGFGGLTAAATTGPLRFGGPNAAGPIVLPRLEMPAAPSSTIIGLPTRADIADAGTSGLVAVDQVLPQGLLGDPYASAPASSPAGAIRNQLAALASSVSLPGTLALMGLAMVGLGLSIRRKDP